MGGQTCHHPRAAERQGGEERGEVAEGLIDVEGQPVPGQEGGLGGTKAAAGIRRLGEGYWGGG